MMSCNTLPFSFPSSSKKKKTVAITFDSTSASGNCIYRLACGRVLNCADGYLLLWCHDFAPTELGAVTPQGLVVVPSAWLLTEAPRLSVGVDAS